MAPAAIKKIIPLSTGTHGGGQHAGPPDGGGGGAEYIMPLHNTRIQLISNFIFFISGYKCIKNFQINQNIQENFIFVDC